MNQESIKEHFKLLGLQVKDAVSGFTGVVTSVSFDLYGCVQAIVTPGLDEKGQPQDGRWFDMKRLAPTAQTPVMALPDFSIVPGPEHKPAFTSNPIR